MSSLVTLGYLVTPGYPWLPCYPWLPLLPLVTPLIPGYPCYPWLPLLPLVTPVTGFNTEYVVYCTLEEVGDSVRMRGLLGIEEHWLPALLPDKCTFGDPLDQPPPAYSPETGG